MCVYAHLYTYVYIPQPKKKVEKGLKKNTEPNYHFYKTTYNELLIKHLMCWEDGSVDRRACCQARWPEFHLQDPT